MYRYDPFDGLRDALRMREADGIFVIPDEMTDTRSKTLPEPNCAFCCVAWVTCYGKAESPQTSALNSQGQIPMWRLCSVTHRTKASFFVLAMPIP